MSNDDIEIIHESLPNVKKYERLGASNRIKIIQVRSMGEPDPNGEKLRSGEARVVTVRARSETRPKFITVPPRELSAGIRRAQLGCGPIPAAPERLPITQSSSHSQYRGQAVRIVTPEKLPIGIIRGDRSQYGYRLIPAASQRPLYLGQRVERSQSYGQEKSPKDIAVTITRRPIKSGGITEQLKQEVRSSSLSPRKEIIISGPNKAVQGATEKASNAVSPFALKPKKPVIHVSNSQERPVVATISPKNSTKGCRESVKAQPNLSEVNTNEKRMTAEEVRKRYRLLHQPEPGIEIIEPVEEPMPEIPKRKRGRPRKSEAEKNHPSRFYPDGTPRKKGIEYVPIIEYNNMPAANSEDLIPPVKISRRSQKSKNESNELAIQKTLNDVISQVELHVEYIKSESVKEALFAEKAEILYSIGSDDLKSSHKRASAFNKTGNSCLRKGDFNKALILYQAAAQENSIALYHSNISLCYLKMGNFKLALEAACKALEANPFNLKALSRKVLAYIGLENYKEALAASDEYCLIIQDEKTITRYGRELRGYVIKYISASAGEIFAKKLQINQIKSLFSNDLKREDYTGITIDVRTAEKLQEILSFFKQQKRMHPFFIYKTLTHTVDLLKDLPNVVFVELVQQKLTVVGNLEGHFFDLLYILQKNGLPNEENYYVFNGNFVGEGSYGLETAFVVFYLKLVYPDYVFLNRGPHECAWSASTYGFKIETEWKANEIIYETFLEVFNCLPLGHVFVAEKNQECRMNEENKRKEELAQLLEVGQEIDKITLISKPPRKIITEEDEENNNYNRVFVVAGGCFSRINVDLALINKVNRINYNPQEDPLIHDILWGKMVEGPKTDKNQIEDYTLDEMKGWCKVNSIDVVIRNQLSSTGCLEHTEPEFKCYALFSASRYKEHLEEFKKNQLNEAMRFIIQEDNGVFKNVAPVVKETLLSFLKPSSSPSLNKGAIFTTFGYEIQRGLYTPTILNFDILNDYKMDDMTEIPRGFHWSKFKTIYKPKPEEQPFWDGYFESRDTFLQRNIMIGGETYRISSEHDAIEWPLDIDTKERKKKRKRKSSNNDDETIDKDKLKQINKKIQERLIRNKNQLVINMRRFRDEEPNADGTVTVTTIYRNIHGSIIYAEEERMLVKNVPKDCILWPDKLKEFTEKAMDYLISTANTQAQTIRSWLAKKEKIPRKKKRVDGPPESNGQTSEAASVPKVVDVKIDQTKEVPAIQETEEKNSINEQQEPYVSKIESPQKPAEQVSPLSSELATPQKPAEQDKEANQTSPAISLAETIATLQVNTSSPTTSKTTDVFMQPGPSHSRLISTPSSPTTSKTTDVSMQPGPSHSRLISTPSQSINIADIPSTSKNPPTIFPRPRMRPNIPLVYQMYESIENMEQNAKNTSKLLTPIANQEADISSDEFSDESNEEEIPAENDPEWTLRPVKRASHPPRGRGRPRKS